MELESGADSVTSTPRSLPIQKLTMSDDKSVVRLMVSFGGKILPRPHDNQLRYVGGDTRIVAVNRLTTFSQLLTKLSKLLLPLQNPITVDFTIKYQLPNEELDALITVSTDEDVENMMEEFDRLSLASSNKIPRLRLFLFPNSINEDDDVSRTSSIASLLDGSRKRENWFLDALNGGSSSALERGRSEASSIVSEVPDYLFGLDNNSDEPPPPMPKFRNRSGLSEPAPGSDPGSPAFGSTSSAPAMPNLPPVKTKPEKIEDEVEPAVQHLSGRVWGQNINPGSPYPAHAVQQVPVYYVPAHGTGPGLVAHRNVVPVSVPIPGPYVPVPQYGPGPGPVQVPVGFSGPSPIYDMQMQGNMVQGQGLMNQQPIYYGIKNGGMVAAYPGTGMPVPGADDGSKGRTLQG